jgi:hypothetical protein
MEGRKGESNWGEHENSIVGNGVWLKCFPNTLEALGR